MNGIVFASPTTRRVRPAFTLVELLVVIVIIGILIALLIPAVTAAMTTARNGVMAIELGGLAQALEAYKTEYGSYPPDFASPADVNDLQRLDAHLARRFRYRLKGISPPKGDLIPVAIPPSMLPLGVKDTKTTVRNLDPSEALVFWLSGFSSDPYKPLTGVGGPVTRDGAGSPLFDFDETRLRDADADGFREYYPKYSEQPYVYLQKDSYPVLTANIIPISTNEVVKPYLSASPSKTDFPYVEPEKYQIVCAGQDGRFGAAGGLYPDGVGYSEADEDNLTSFSDGKTLEDAIP